LSLRRAQKLFLFPTKQWSIQRVFLKNPNHSLFFILIHVIRTKDIHRNIPSTFISLHNSEVLIKIFVLTSITDVPIFLSLEILRWCWEILHVPLWNSISSHTGTVFLHLCLYDEDSLAFEAIFYYQFFRNLNVHVCPLIMIKNTIGMWKIFTKWPKQQVGASLRLGECTWVECIAVFFFVVLGFELRGLHSQSRCSTAWATPPVHFAVFTFGDGGLVNYLARLVSNHDPPDLSLPCSYSYRCESPAPDNEGKVLWGKF
jgi:hypothetical protein